MRFHKIIERTKVYLSPKRTRNKTYNYMCPDCINHSPVFFHMFTSDAIKFTQDGGIVEKCPSCGWWRGINE